MRLSIGRQEASPNFVKVPLWGGRSKLKEKFVRLMSSASMDRGAEGIDRFTPITARPGVENFL
jgi:hypothetical protein